MQQHVSKDRQSWISFCATSFPIHWSLIWNAHVCINKHRCTHSPLYYSQSLSWFTSGCVPGRRKAWIYTNGVYIYG